MSDKQARRTNNQPRRQTPEIKKETSMKPSRKENSTALNHLVLALLNAPWRTECFASPRIAYGKRSLRVIAAALLLASASPASFGQNAGIFPPGSTSYGHSYGE